MCVRYKRLLLDADKENSRVHRHHQDATSLKIPVPNPRETDCRLRLTEDDDIRNLLTPGVDLHPCLVTKVKENDSDAFGKFDLTNLPTEPLGASSHVIACGHHSQLSQIVENCTRACQNSSFSHTRDILHILIGSLLEDERNEEPAILHDEGEFSGEGLTRG